MACKASPAVSEVGWLSTHDGSGYCHCYCYCFVRPTSQVRLQTQPCSARSGRPGTVWRSTPLSPPASALSGVLCGGGGDGAACAQGTAGAAHAWALVTVVYSWTQMEEHSGCSLNVAKVTPLWV